MDSSSSPSSPLIPSKPKETTVSLFCSRNRTLHFSLVSSRPEEGTVASANDVPRHPSLSFDSVCTLSVHELNKFKELTLLRVYAASDLLVNLLQERAQLSEEAHVRAISIE